MKIPVHSRSLSAGAALLVALAIQPHEARAQEQPDSVRVQLQRLTAMVDSLRREVERLRAANQPAEAEDALAQLRAAAQAAASSGGQAPPPSPTDAQPQEFVGRQRSLQALNPEISMTGDVFAQVKKDDANSENFFAREFELSIISNLDPYSRAKAFISRHVHGGEIEPFAGGPEEEEGGGFSVEEGYVEWVSLPGGVGLKLGRFYQQLGQLNRWHSHAYPFQSRSLPHLAFVGEEPLGQTGASVRWLAPVGGSAGTYTFTGEITRSENERLFGASGRLSFLGNVNAFWQLSDATDLDLSLTAVNGDYEATTGRADRNLYNAEMSFTWSPPARTRYRGLNVRAGVMVLAGLPDDPDASAMGFYTMAETKLGQSWLIGGRLDRVENPLDTSETAWLAGPTLTWWQSEFVRIRGEYDLLGRGDVRDGRFLLQATFSVGPHKHETY